MRILFTQSYNLREQEIKFVHGVAGIYFIFLADMEIPYPFQASRLIYIGMSESKQNSLSMRLKGHLTGQSGNMGISNYAKKYKTKFTYYSAEVLKTYGNDNVYDLESFFLTDFMKRHGSHPICNGQAGHKLSDLSKRLTVEVDWKFFY